LGSQADADERGSQTRLTSAEKEELAQLRRDKRRLEVEVEILERAAAYSLVRIFSQTDLPPGP
jgi:transposase-like protein